jgi:nucleotide-binding universal stress UspA family protein
MPNSAFQTSYAGAIEDFRRARRQAMMEQVLSHLSGKSVDALSYEQVRKTLKIEGQKPPELQDIPLDAIVGSVGRYSDFSRSFLPKDTVDEHRWAGVKVATTGLAGLPPIEVYQIGEAYFVLDGNHRVSVARQLGASHIEAYVTELETKVPVTATDQLDDVILKAEHLDFLDETQIHEIRAEADLRVTAPGQYRLLAEQIHIHRYFLGLDLKRDISHEEAVASWYDTVYEPVVKVIRDSAMLRHFPDRTETDLYLWASEHRDVLRQELGWEVEPTAAAADLSSQADSGVRRAVTQVGKTVLDAVTSDEPGQLRRERTRARQDDRLFAAILVPLRGDERCWQVLTQAFEFAWREGSQLRGLHVVSTEAELESENALVVQAEFGRRCQEAGVSGRLTIASGRVSSQICVRSRWTDLVILSLEHPPPPSVLGRLGSGFRSLLRQCAGPVLAVPGPVSTLSHALLAYDGSPKAEEALFVATYLAGRWHISLTVATVSKSPRTAEKTQARAREYLSRQEIQAAFVQDDGPAAPKILEVAEDKQTDFIIMGGYGHHAVTEVTLGSTVGAVLRTSRQPTLICQ